VGKGINQDPVFARFFSTPIACQGSDSGAGSLRQEIVNEKRIVDCQNLEDIKTEGQIFETGRSWHKTLSIFLSRIFLTPFIPPKSIFLQTGSNHPLEKAFLSQ
jgi:hypothetical protein